MSTEIPVSPLKYDPDRILVFGDDTEEKSPPLFTPHFANGLDPYSKITWVNRVACIKGPNGKVVFKQENVSFPDFWSQTAVNICTEKYFRGKLGTPEREDNLAAVITRIARTISDWGVEQGYFTRAVSHEFYCELVHLMVYQKAAFNSPVWFNLGIEKHPQVSACFIQSVEDSMEGIMDLARSEAILFKGGSGTGTNFSTLRSSKEYLNGGGKSSGPLSFMRGLDSFAGAIKSGGKCITGNQQVLTNLGPKPVSELVDDKFVVLSYDPPACRFKAKWARAWKSGNKPIIRVHTDKGVFDTSEDHPFKLSTGESRLAKDLVEGNSLFSCTIRNSSIVNLKDGFKGKEPFYRLIARDILGEDLIGKIVHHKDGNHFNNSLDNLEIITQSDHAYIHGKDFADKGEHIFVRESFDKSGANNGMHRSRPFWENKEKVTKWKNNLGKAIQPYAHDMQYNAANQKMLNTAYFILNAGYSIDTFEEYIKGRRLVLGNIPVSHKKLLSTINVRFGNYDNFIKEVRINNHRVKKIEYLGNMCVYSVEVECPTADDKSAESGHNFVIWSGNFKDGSGVCVFNTRRAAKMCILNVEHPDIMEFIRCKADEEKKARALKEAGFKQQDLTDIAVQYQNANNSVRVTDHFMRNSQLKAGRHVTTYVTKQNTHKFPHTVNGCEEFLAKDVLHEIAQATWECGDPGMQFHDTINKWNTCKSSGNITASNPCSEYMHLDDTACNLASLNLRKFESKKNGVENPSLFDTESFCRAVEVMIIAQDIMVDKASYPTKKIEEGAKAYRQLGLGYANLGALLMANAIPYDSDRARTIAASITDLMQSQAWLTSCRIAEKLGPFDGYHGLANEKSVREVYEKHGEAHLSAKFHDDDELAAAAISNNWAIVGRMLKENGIRNSQLTVLAPTGTIGFVMDCDTTGIEPELGLVKYKNMVGGGQVKLVNKTAKDALSFMYRHSKDDMFLERSVAYLEENGHFEGHLNDESLAVFDCSFAPAEGKRSLAPMAHIKMMEAVQPFLSGAISKTVNIPHEATVEDIEGLYTEAWKRGLKSIAIYRDGCKSAQPLTMKKEEKDLTIRALISDRHRAGLQCLPSSDCEYCYGRQPLVLEKALHPEGSCSCVNIGTCDWCILTAKKKELDELKDKLTKNSKETAEYLWGKENLLGQDDMKSTTQATRRKLPDERVAICHKFKIAEHKGYIHVGLYPDGSPGEIFIKMAKEGSTISGLMDGLAQAVSIGLQHGVPLKAFTKRLSYMRFEPAGFTNNPEIRMAKSIIDYIFRWLDLRYGSEVGLTEPPTVESGIVGEVETPAVGGYGYIPADNPTCPNCGNFTIRNGSCYRCPDCGDSLGCS